MVKVEIEVGDKEIRVMIDKAIDKLLEEKGILRFVRDTIKIETHHIVSNIVFSKYGKMRDTLKTFESKVNRLDSKVLFLQSRFNTMEKSK